MKGHSHKTFTEWIRQNKTYWPFTLKKKHSLEFLSRQHLWFHPKLKSIIHPLNIVNQSLSILYSEKWPEAFKYHYTLLLPFNINNGTCFMIIQISTGVLQTEVITFSSLKKKTGLKLLNYTVVNRWIRFIWYVLCMERRNSLLPHNVWQ